MGSESRYKESSNVEESEGHYRGARDMKKILELDGFRESDETRLRKRQSALARWAKMRDAGALRAAARHLRDKPIIESEEEEPSRLSRLESRLERIEQELGL